MIYRAEFDKWLSESGHFSSRKLLTDACSRVVKVEEQLKKQFGESYSLENEYSRDKGIHVLKLFERKGNNEVAAQLLPGILPIGKGQMYPLKSAVNLYFNFLESKKNNEQE